MAAVPSDTSPSRARILVVDDDPDILQAARLFLKRHFAMVETLRDPQRLAELVRQSAFDVLLLDMNFAAGRDDGGEGLTLLARVLAIDAQAVVVLITAHGAVQLAVDAMKQGAADFVTKPWQNERLLATLLAAYNLRRSRAEAVELRDRNRGLAAAMRTDAEPIGTSKPMLRVFETIRRAAPTDANTLILGENGTGKELVAREIHRHSRRTGEVFLRVDLGALSPHLFESELFGHRRGAFTDAREDRIGLFRAATGGTLFLDEIGNVPLHLQSKLLTALERREVTPVGSDRAEPVDVRLVCATNLAPERLADPNVFRPDLLYRINTVDIVLPPLRDRREDIPLLLEHFVAMYSDKYNVAPRRLSALALERLMSHSWPGNVRELRHAVERAVILGAGSMLEAEDFSLSGRPGPQSPGGSERGITPGPQSPGGSERGITPGPQSPGGSERGITPGSERGLIPSRPAIEGLLAEANRLDDIEKNAIARVLQANNGNVSRAAEALGLTRGSLYRRMQKYGL